MNRLNNRLDKLENLNRAASLQSIPADETAAQRYLRLLDMVPRQRASNHSNQYTPEEAHRVLKGEL